MTYSAFEFLLKTYSFNAINSRKLYISDLLNGSIRASPARFFHNETRGYVNCVTCCLAKNPDSNVLLTWLKLRVRIIQPFIVSDF